MVNKSSLRLIIQKITSLIPIRNNLLLDFIYLAANSKLLRHFILNIEGGWTKINKQVFEDR
jgi:hypothetical protein